MPCHKDRQVEAESFTLSFPTCSSVSLSNKKRHFNWQCFTGSVIYRTSFFVFNITLNLNTWGREFLYSFAIQSVKKNIWNNEKNALRERSKRRKFNQHQQNLIGLFSKTPRDQTGIAEHTDINKKWNSRRFICYWNFQSMSN